MQSVSMKVNGIKLVWIVVKDLQAAIKFYTEVVGLTLNSQSPEYGWAELSGPDGCAIGLAQENSQMDNKAGTNAVTTITVDNIETARAHFLQHGATLLGEVEEVSGHVKMQTFKDTDENMLQLVEMLDAHPRNQ